MLRKSQNGITCWRRQTAPRKVFSHLTCGDHLPPKHLYNAKVNSAACSDRARRNNFSGGALEERRATHWKNAPTFFRFKRLGWCSKTLGWPVCSHEFSRLLQRHTKVPRLTDAIQVHFGNVGRRSWNSVFFLKVPACRHHFLPESSVPTRSTVTGKLSQRQHSTRQR